MKYALGNMLNGAGSINPDGLALDLQFAADKTLTARRGPTPTFSRASSGTFVNANGLIVGKTAGTTSSITPSTQAIGSQVTVTVASGSVVGWVIGQAISLIVDTDGQDDPDATELWLLGNIVSTTDTTLVFSVTSRTAQAGSATSWTLGYRGPRFDHTSAGVCRGLLIEESRTNLLARSQEFNLSPWGTNNAMTVTPDATIAPDGTLTADAINFDTNSTSRIIYLTGSAVVHTFSVWLRADTNRTCIIATAANLSANIEVVANVTTTWQRFSVVASNWSSSTASFNVRIANNATGTSGTIFAWGAQLEAGSFATSYIPTTTGTLARSADVCSITGGDFTSMWNASEGSMLATAQLATAAATANPFLLDFYSAVPHEWGFRFFSNNFQVVQRDGSIKDINLTSLSSQPFTFAAARNSSNSAGSVYGLVVSGAGSSLNNFTGVDIGRRAGGSLYFNGTIAAIRYYKKRLPNAKLQALTV